MKRTVKKLRICRIIIVFMIIFLMIYFSIFFIQYGYPNKIRATASLDESTYIVIKEDFNPNYEGEGQSIVENKDGYYTTFTTISNNQKTYIEYKQNGKSSWKNNPYWDSNMENSGCGITAMSIILSGYKKNITPEDLRKKYYPVLHGNEISKELSKTFKIINSDFYYDNMHLSNEYIINHLKSNRPILICVWTKNGLNRWTSASHYMVLLATDGISKVYLSNPNGIEDYKASGWYSLDEILPYTAKALFVESYS